MTGSQSSAGKRARPTNTDAGQITKKPKTQRKRAAIACEECRIRKRRCDGAAPACGACMKRMRTCKYAADGQPRDWRGRIMQSLRNQLEELEKEDRAADPTTWQQHNDDDSTPQPVQGLQHRIVSGRNSDKDDGMATQDIIDVIRPNTVDRPNTSLLLSREDSPFGDDQNCHQPHTPMRLGTSDARSTNSEEIQASGSLERMMEPIINQITNDSGNTDVETFNMALSTDMATPITPAVVQSKKTDCNCDNLLHTRRQWCLPLRRSADTLVARFFSRHNLNFPIFNERTFRRQYQRLWDSSPAACCGLCEQRSQGKLLLPTVYAVFAYASLFMTNQPDQNAIKARSFFRMAEEFDLLQVLDNEVGLELVQLLLLMGKHLQSTEQLSKFKNISGLAMRMAQSMGLHYSVGEAQKRGMLSDPATQMDCEMRSRVWYGCVLLERDIPLYLCFGRSLSPAVGDGNCPLPEAIDDDQLSDEVGRNGKQPERSPSTLEPFIAMIKLHEILNQALGRDNSYSENVSDASISIQSLLRLDILMHRWRDALPEHLQFESSLDNCTQAEPIASTLKPQSDSDAGIPAKKMHLRYLHASQLVLRPALELYFKRTQSKQFSSNPRQRQDDLEDLMLTKMATKCVVSALTIIELLSAESEAHIFMAWWFNIAYLHACGSTILMARMCTFNNVQFNHKSLRASWNTCLKTLERYARVSSIARRSSYLLYQSAERLFSVQPTRCGDELGQQTTSNFSMNTNLVRTWAPGPVVQRNQSINRLGQNSSRKNNSGASEPSEDLSGMASFWDSNLDFGFLPDLEDNLWTGNLDPPSWSLMPSVDPVETLPPRFGF